MKKNTKTVVELEFEEIKKPEEEAKEKGKYGKLCAYIIFILMGSSWGDMINETLNFELPKFFTFIPEHISDFLISIATIVLFVYLAKYYQKVKTISYIIIGIEIFTAFYKLVNFKYLYSENIDTPESISSLLFVLLFIQLITQIILSIQCIKSGNSRLKQLAIANFIYFAATLIALYSGLSVIISPQIPLITLIISEIVYYAYLIDAVNNHNENK